MREREAPVGVRTDRWWAGAVAGGVVGAWVLAVCLVFGDELARLAITGRWFQNDGWRVFDDMTRFEANHHRTNVRPWFSLVMIPIAGVTSAVTGLGALAQVWVLNALTAGAIGWLLWSVLRRLGADAVGASVGVALFAVSGGALFWLTVPSTYGLGALAMLGCVWLISRERVRDWQLVLAGGFTLGTAITNGMAIAAASISRRGVVRTGVIGVLSLAVLMGGWAAQKAIFPLPASPFWRSAEQEMQFVGHESQGGALRAMRVHLTSPIVVPVVEDSAFWTDASPQGAMLSIQWSDPADWGPLTTVAVAAWGVLLSLGLWNVRRIERVRAVYSTVGLIVLGQVGFHMFYGEETFLYTLHITPMLVLLAASTMIASRSNGVRAGVAACVVLIGANNLSELARVSDWPTVDAPDERLERLDGRRAGEPG